MISKPSNKRPGADAGWRVQFAFVSLWPRAAQAERWMQVRARLLSLLAGWALMMGCASQQPHVAPLDPPREGKILVSVGGNIMASGSIWLAEGSSLAALEDLVGWRRPEWESHRVRITRIELGGKKTLEFRLDKMTPREKEAVRLQHGDAVFFVWDRCFGSAPNQPASANPAIGFLFQAERFRRGVAEPGCYENS